MVAWVAFLLERPRRSPGPAGTEEPPGRRQFRSVRMVRAIMRRSFAIMPRCFAASELRNVRVRFLPKVFRAPRAAQEHGAVAHDHLYRFAHRAERFLAHRAEGLLLGQNAVLRRKLLEAFGVSPGRGLRIGRGRLAARRSRGCRWRGSRRLGRRWNRCRPGLLLRRTATAQKTSTQYHPQ